MWGLCLQEKDSGQVTGPPVEGPGAAQEGTGAMEMVFMFKSPSGLGTEGLCTIFASAITAPPSERGRYAARRQ